MTTAWRGLLVDRKLAYNLCLLQKEYDLERRVKPVFREGVTGYPSAFQILE